MASSLRIIDRAEDAAVLLKPGRRRVLEMLATPDSAAGLARRLKMARQLVHYHLRELENAGLVELVEERRKGNCRERIMRRVALAYVISPQALGSLAADPAAIADHLSASYLVAVAARAIRDLSRLGRAAEAAGKLLPTFTLETEVRFRSAADRDGFTRELAEALAELARKYHDPTAPGGRRFRFFTGAYPAIAEEQSHERDEKDKAARIDHPDPGPA